jgi:hypothetical protein
VKSAENMAMSTRIARRKPRCSTIWGRGICRTSTTGKVDLNLMQAHPFWIWFRFVYNWRTSWTSKLRSTRTPSPSSKSYTRCWRTERTLRCLEGGE